MLTETLQIIETFGVIGVLVVGIFAFMRGMLWPKSMVDKMIEAQQKASEQTAKIIAHELGDRISAGVAEGMERGLARGYLKINGDTPPKSKKE